MALSFKEELPTEPLSSSSDDPSMRLSRERVAAARADSSGRVYRVYCDGVFDLFHLAHMRMFEQAKRALGGVDKVHLIAGVCSDELVHQFKGKTVMDHKLRCESVRHCRWVDEVLPDAPWVLTDGYLQAHGIDFVAHDALPYKDTTGTAASATDVYFHIKQRGMFLETQRTEGLSTSDVIVHIIRDYDEYVIRNLDRGYSKEELNVGASWQVRARFHQKQREFRRSLERMKGEQRRAEDAAIAFIREFNPKYLMRKVRSHESIAEMEDEPSNTRPQRPHSSNGRPAVDGAEAGERAAAEDEEKEGEEGGSLQFTPADYYSRLKETLPERSAGLLHHSAGLAWAVLETTGYFLSYLNPLSYFQSANKKKN